LAWSDAADDALLAALEEFGEPVVYRPAAGGEFDLPHGGLFDEAWAEVDTGGQRAVSATAPAVLLATADLARFGITPGEDQQDRLVVSKRTWRIHDTQPDGQGGIRLILKRST
jgi:hypothetical protein